jgi:16S rRNA (uracil1498-N3)-methyltransferase
MFYLPDFSQPVLSETESQHAIKVLRLQKGKVIDWSDGKGNRGTARISEADSRKCQLEILEVNALDRPWKGNLTIAIAPTKNLDRMEWLVEKATEIGCNGFIFFRTARTERDNIKLERLEKVAVSAMKQSGQSWLPTFQWLPKWNLSFLDWFPTKILTDLGEKAQPFPSLSSKTESLLIIGPEGDFTPQERRELLEKGTQSVRLCPQVLRTETAALFALSLGHSRMEV